MGASIAALMSMFWWHPAFSNDPDAEVEFDAEQQRIHDAAAELRRNNGGEEAPAATKPISAMNMGEVRAALENEHDAVRTKALKQQITLLEAAETERARAAGK